MSLGLWIVIGLGAWALISIGTSWVLAQNAARGKQWDASEQAYRGPERRVNGRNPSNTPDRNEGA